MVVEFRATDGSFDQLPRFAEELVRSKATIAARERRLLDALADGDGAAEAIRGRLQAELGRRDALTAELAHLETAPSLDADALVRAVTARAADLRNLLGRNVAQARQVVRQLLEGRLVCQPFEDAEARGYTFAATGTYRRLGVPLIETSSVNYGGGPNGVRTRVSALRGRRRRQGWRGVRAPLPRGIATDGLCSGPQRGVGHRGIPPHHPLRLPAAEGLDDRRGKAAVERHRGPVEPEVMEVEVL